MVFWTLRKREPAQPVVQAVVDPTELKRVTSWDGKYTLILKLNGNIKCLYDGKTTDDRPAITQVVFPIEFYMDLFEEINNLRARITQLESRTKLR